MTAFAPPSCLIFINPTRDLTNPSRDLSNPSRDREGAV